MGYILSEFIVLRWGPAALVALVRSNGDIAGTLGLSPADFETQWHADVTQRYFPSSERGPPR